MMRWHVRCLLEGYRATYGVLNTFSMSVVIAFYDAAKCLHVERVDLRLVLDHEKLIKTSPSDENAHRLYITSQNDGRQIISVWQNVLDAFAVSPKLKCIEYTNKLSIAATSQVTSRGKSC